MSQAVRTRVIFEQGRAKKEESCLNMGCLRTNEGQNMSQAVRTRVIFGQGKAKKEESCLNIGRVRTKQSQKIGKLSEHGLPSDK